MKVFNQEVNNCTECVYSSNRSGIALCGGNLESKKVFKLNDEIFDENLGYYIRPIHKDCPFNKPLTKKDIESFGFKFNPNNNDMSKNINSTNYYLKQWDDKSIDISRVTDGEGYVVTIFQGTITSKSHLQFILQSLNII